MKFQIEDLPNKVKTDYKQSEIDVAYKFAAKAHEEFGVFLKGVILFGSAARVDHQVGDIDVMLIIDDVTVKVSDAMIQTYRIITNELVSKINTKLHVTTLKFSSFWEYVRAGDPIGINILRDGVALLDTGFFDPLQRLLLQGRIRPTPEAIWSYFAKAPKTMLRAKWHVTQATLDLYWSVIDSAHAVLMEIGEIPPSPRHVADLMDEKMVKTNLLESKYVKTMRFFYNLSRKITHQEVIYIRGSDFDKYESEARAFVLRMKKFLEKRTKK